jgi:AcrR family transcriptional regulator
MKIHRKASDAGAGQAGAAAGQPVRARSRPRQSVAVAAPLARATADRPASTRGRKPVDGLVESRRGQIREAAIRLFSRKGFDATTLEDVARDADVSVGLIYRYFKGKEDLLFSTILDIQEDYTREIPKAAEQGCTPLERFGLAVQAYGRVVDRHRRAALLGYRASHLLGRDRLRIIIDKELETNGLIRAAVDDCVASGAFRATDVQMFTYQIISFVHSWAMESWRLPRELGIDEFVARGLALMLPAVLSEMPGGKIAPSRGIGARRAHQRSSGKG